VKLGPPVHRHGYGPAGFRAGPCGGVGVVVSVPPVPDQDELVLLAAGGCCEVAVHHPVELGSREADGDVFLAGAPCLLDPGSSQFEAVVARDDPEVGCLVVDLADVGLELDGGFEL